MAKKAKPAFPNSNLIKKQIGATSQQDERLREFIDRTPQFTDVAALLPKVAGLERTVVELPGSNHDVVQPVPGYVYLVRSGKFVAAFKRRRLLM